MTKRQITDDLDAILGVLPEDIRKATIKANNGEELIEIIMDLGRVPTARLISEEIVLLEREVVQEDIDHVVERLGRAAIDE